jgi:glucose-6-phosphate 1-dehydrogenase
MVLRFGNVMYEALWNSALIDHVQITVAESLGVGSRGGYYDGSGALRDMVQNHMLQLLCLVAMEPPDTYDANAIRDEKLKILKALKPITGEAAESCVVRGQYRAASPTGPRAGLSRGDRGCGERHGNICGDQGAGRQLALGQCAVLPATGKRCPRGRRRSSSHSSLCHTPYSRVRRARRSQPAGGAPAALTRGEAMDHDQGSGPGRDALRHVPFDMSFAEAFRREIRTPTNGCCSK